MHLGRGGRFNTHRIPSQGFGEGSGGMPEGNSEKQGARSIYLTRAAGSGDTDSSCTADGIVNQAERDEVADIQGVEGGDVLQIRPVEEHVPPRADANKPVHLSNEELGDAPGRHRANRVGRPFKMKWTMTHFQNP